MPLHAMEPSPETRTIRTKMGREVTITGKNVIRVVGGLLGFPEYEQYALLPYGEDSPFYLMQSLEEERLAFITIDPRLFAPGYVPDVPPEDFTSLDLAGLAGAVLLAIVVIPEDPAQMTANLQGPLVINPQTHTGRQLISRSPEHRVRHHILSGGAPGAR